jgi:drug/metabolite transporter (DMT)-like permease
VLVLAFVVWQRRAFKMLAARDVITLAALGFLAIAFHQGLQATGLQFTSAGSMAWIVATTPVFTALLAWLFLGEVFGAVRVLGLVIAFAGVLIVVTKGVFTPDTVRLPSTIGDLLALASALNWAIFSVASKPLLRRLPPALMMAYLMFLGWLATLPFFAAGQAWNDLPNLSWQGWTAIAFLGVFCSGIAYIFWYDALSVIDAAQTAAFIYLEPFVTVVVAAMVLRETFTLIAFLGGLAILLGVYLVNRPAAPVKVWSSVQD